MELDEDAKKELNLLKREVKGKEIAVKIDKENFQKKLMDGMGEDMMENLKHPKKPSFWVGLKYKYLRWKTIRKGNREMKRYLKKNKNGEQ